MPLPLEEGLAAVPQTLSAFYRFSRPHTMLGTFVSVLSVSALAVVSTTASCCHPCITRSALHAPCFPVQVHHC